MEPLQSQGLFSKFKHVKSGSKRCALAGVAGETLWLSLVEADFRRGFAEGQLSLLKLLRIFYLFEPALERGELRPLFGCPLHLELLLLL